jgi:phage baseplate assembly protein W
MRGFAFDGAGLGSRLGEGASTGLVRSPQGRVAMAQGDALIRQSIMLLLTTRPGERVMRPDYGCPLHRLIFAPNDATTAGLAIHYVRQAIARWEKRIDIVRLDAGPDPQDPGALAIKLDYRVRESGTQQRVELALPLDGGPG